MGQGFKNHYESTKFQAEVWVRELLDRVPTTILRPAIVVGDSRTGETEKFDGPYYVLRASRALTADGQADAAVRALGRRRSTWSRSTTWSRRWSPPPATRRPWARPCTWSTPTRSAPTIWSSCSRALYTGTGTRGRVPAAMVERSLRMKRVREMFEGIPAESIAYLNHPVVYDARRTVDLLAPHGLVPPRFPDYAEAVVGFYREHEGDPALRPKPPA